MAVSLTFDADGCYRAMVNKLIEVADSIMEEFYNDAILGLDADGKEDSERIDAVINKTSGYIEAQCKFYANALMESFGIGNGADTGPDSYWNEYKQMPFFNKLRRSRTVVGRTKGTYTNIFGEEQESTGKNAGKNLETLHIIGREGNYVQVKPLAAKRSIQNAERWLIKNHQRRVEDRIEEELKNFFSTEVKNFFIEVNV